LLSAPTDVRPVSTVAAGLVSRTSTLLKPVLVLLRASVTPPLKRLDSPALPLNGSVEPKYRLICTEALLAVNVVVPPTVIAE
jgi:hypothetical protein